MYKVTAKPRIKDNGEKIIMYGIKKDCEEYSEISSNREEIIQLCELCNESELSDIHFKDVVEDFIASKVFCTPEEINR